MVWKKLGRKKRKKYDQNLLFWNLYCSAPGHRLLHVPITTGFCHLINQGCLINIEITVLTNLLEVLYSYGVNLIAHRHLFLYISIPRYLLLFYFSIKKGNLYSLAKVVPGPYLLRFISMSIGSVLTRRCYGADTDRVWRCYGACMEILWH